MFREENRVLTAIVTFTFVGILFSSNVFIQPVAGKKCPGKCISNITQCKAAGGKIAGYCTNQLACCDYSYRKKGTCGSKMTKLSTAFFRSPDYPDYSSGDLICQFDFALSKNASGLIIEFSDVMMDGVGFVKQSGCESDMIYFKGFPDWTPPAQCGNLSNYAAVIDLGNHHTKGMTTLTLLAIMSSSKYRWNIQVRQVFLNKQDNSETPIPSPEDYSESSEDDDNDTIYPPLTSISNFSTLSEPESEDEEVSRIMQLSTLLNKKKSNRFVANEYEVESNTDYNSDDEFEEEPFIVNGEDTEITSVPWQASLRTIVSPKAVKLLPKLNLKNCTIDEGLHFCGGTVISDRHILSATHCVQLGEKLSTWQRVSSIKVVLGDSNICDENKDGVQEFKVDKIYYHYAYDNDVIMNDVIVIKVNKRIKFTDKVKPIKMASEGMKFENMEVSASGWGLTNLTADGDKKSTPEQLQFTGNLFLGNRSYCSKQQMQLYPSMKRTQFIKYPKYLNIFNSLLCSHARKGKVSRAVGQGDSGGPLVVLPTESANFTEANVEEPLLIGVISYMIPIANETMPHDISRYVDFFQSVSFFRQWINVALAVK